MAAVLEEQTPEQMPLQTWVRLRQAEVALEAMAKTGEMVTARRAACRAEVEVEPEEAQ